jgi:hypothetical protein
MISAQTLSRLSRGKTAPLHHTPHQFLEALTVNVCAKLALGVADNAP